MISGTRYRLDQEINRQLACRATSRKAQTQLSTQKRIQSPSEDPVAAARISSIGRAQANEAGVEEQSRSRRRRSPPAPTPR